MDDLNENQIDDAEEAVTGMEEVDAFDFARAMMLLSVIKEVANTAPKSMAISGLALAALEEMNVEAKEIGRKRVEALKNLERKRAEAIRAQAKEREEAEAAEQADEDEAARGRGGGRRL